MRNPFRYFKASPDIIRLTVMMYVRFPLSLRQVEDLLLERGIDISYETVRAWWNLFGPMFANEIKKKRSASMQRLPQWRWHLDEVFVRINGETYYLWRAVDHEGEVLEVFVTKKRDRKAALRFLKKAMFRSAKSLQKFAAVHASVQNHYNQQRHLYSRKNFKLNRSAALTEWRQLAG